MATEPCPECQSLWDESRDGIAKIHHLRESTEVALRSHDHEEARKLQMSLDSLERKSALVRQSLAEHQRGLHSRPRMKLSS
jgi:hypothetical protein